jgi:general secretion pathway protein F
MAAFAYKAFNSGGQTKAGQVEARTLRDAESALASGGLTVFEIVPVSRPTTGAQQVANEQGSERWWQRELGRERAPSAKQLAEFASELGMLTGAGISIDQSLGLVADNSSNGFQKRVSRRLRAAILEGSSLSDAMKQNNAVFSDELIAIVRASEAASDLTGGLNRLSALLNRRAQMQTEMKSAFLYPAILLVASIGVLLVVVNVLIPNIKPLFDEARAPVPAFIRILDNLHSFLIANWAFVGGLLLAAVFVARLCMRHSPVRAALDAMALKIPLLASSVRRLEASRFTRALGAQVISGVSLLPALTVASESLRNREVRRLVDGAVEKIRDGQQPSVAFRETNPFPPITYQLMAAGEGSGRLGPVLLQLAETFEQAQQTSVKRAMSLMAPLLTLGLGLLVGLLMMSVMNAVTSLNDFALR